MFAELVTVWVLTMTARQTCNTPEQCEQNIRPYVEWVFEDHPTVTVDQAVNIIECESNWKPSARNPNSTAGGVFQFLQGTYHGEAHWHGWPHPLADAENRFDPVHAINLAALVVERDGGWRQWECQP